MEVKSESEVAQSCPTLATPWTAAYHAPPSMGFSRQEYWSGVSLPSPISHASKVILKILQARLQMYVNWQLPDVQTGFRKGRGTRDQIANIRWIIEKAREFQKNIYFCFINYARTFDCVDHNKLWKFLKRWENQATLLASWETCIQVRKQQLELDMEQQIGSKWKGVCQDSILSPCVCNLYA